MAFKLMRLVQGAEELEEAVCIPPGLTRDFPHVDPDRGLRPRSLVGIHHGGTGEAISSA